MRSACFSTSGRWYSRFVLCGPKRPPLSQKLVNVAPGGGAGVGKIELRGLQTGTFQEWFTPLASERCHPEGCSCPRDLLFVSHPCGKSEYPSHGELQLSGILRARDHTKIGGPKDSPRPIEIHMLARIERIEA